MMEKDPEVSPALLEALDPAAGAPKAPDTGESFARLQAKMNNDSPRRKISAIYKYVGVAACAVIVFSVLKYFSTSIPQTKTYTTVFGQSLSFALEDGTRVTLAPGTTLNVTGINATLNGEAAFTVNHNKSRSFIVNANGSKISVLGTRFAVRAYDKNVRVAVADGRVSVNLSVLSVNDVANVRDGKVSVTQAQNVSDMFSFTSGTLRFTSTPLRDAIPDLERWYDVTIVVTSPDLAAEPFTATFAQGSRGNLAAILGMTFNAKVVREGRVITISR